MYCANISVEHETANWLRIANIEKKITNTFTYSNGVMISVGGSHYVSIYFPSNTMI